MQDEADVIKYSLIKFEKFLYLLNRQSIRIIRCLQVTQIYELKISLT